MKNNYICTTALVIDGKAICVPGKLYTIVDAVPTENETLEDVAGYCDILGCENGEKCMATWIDVAEYFKEANGKLIILKNGEENTIDMVLWVGNFDDNFPAALDEAVTVLAKSAEIYQEVVKKFLRNKGYIIYDCPYEEFCDFC